MFEADSEKVEVTSYCASVFSICENGPHTRMSSRHRLRDHYYISS